LIGIMDEKRIGVIGAGVMGCDLALDLAFHGFEVLLKDLSEEILAEAEQRMRSGYKFIKMMKREFSPLEELLARIRWVNRYDGFEDAGVVIENITESYKAKKSVYAELRDVCGEDTLYGVNTSCIPITQIARLMPKPENVVGMHFLNPVPLKNLVEVIRTDVTSEQALERAQELLKSMDKSWVVVNDAAGFVTNRVLMLTINECFWVLQDGIAGARDVDTIFKIGFGHKMGPLATADLIGLDTIRNSLLVLYENYKDPKYKPCPLLDEMVKAGYLGKKSNKSLFEFKKGARHLFSREK